MSPWIDMNDRKRQFKEQIDEMMEAFQQLLSDDEIKSFRKFIFSYILEMYSALNYEGDSLPEMVKLGAYGDKWIILKVVNNEL